MNQSHKLDIICIDKILKYVKTINDACAMFNIGSADDLENNHICQLAITQAITNIYELRQKMQDTTLTEMAQFSKLRLGLKAARNIASHDYDSLDFGIINRIVKQLSSQALIKELEMARDGIRQNNPSD